MLVQIQEFFGGIGHIHKTENLVFYTVSNIKEIRKTILPHFIKYHMLSQKAEDFRLFRLIVEHMENKAHYTIEGLREIINIKASLNKGLSTLWGEAIKSEFINIKPVLRQRVITNNISDPSWITGFVNGEGTFDVKIYTSQNKVGQAVQLRFRISQHERDRELIELLIQYLECGQIEEHSKHPAVAIVVSKFADNAGIIIPFFKQYPLIGVKRLDFQDWCSISNLIVKGSNLTYEGLNTIRLIKEGMNNSRKDFS